ncbi:MAG: hypothetical protein IBJ01_09425 [Leptospira sp.]|nr:hypothetical protein [Leptospira sp.]
MVRFFRISLRLLILFSLTLSLSFCKPSPLESTCDVESKSFFLASLMRFATGDKSPSCLPAFPFYEEFGLYGGVFGPPAKVYAMTSYRNHLLIAGDFTLAGLATGSVSVLHPQSGAAVPSRFCPFLKVKGATYTAVSDGSGGFYIGGEFTHVQGYARSQVAHILPGCQLDPNFNPVSDPSRSIYALHLLGDNLYVGGFFGSWGSGTQSNLASLNRYTGQLNSGFNAGTIDNFVYAITSFGSSLFVGGSFQTVNSVSKFGIVKLSASTGSIDSSFTSQLSSSGSAFDLYMGTDFQGSPILYVGGSFTTPRNNAVAFYPDGTLTTWNPNPNATVESIQQYENQVYLGGSFTSVTGAATTNGLVAVDNQSGTVTNNTFGVNQSVSTIQIIGNQLYALGQFTNAKGIPRNYAAGFDLPSGTLNNWNPSLEEPVTNPGGAIIPYGGAVALTNAKSSVNVQAKRNFVVIDEASGAPIDGTPQFDYPIKSIHVKDNHLFLGGSFETINGIARRGFAVLDLPTYELNPTNLQITDPSLEIRTITSANGQIFFGGTGMTTVSGQTRNGVAAISSDTFQLTNWNPNIGANSATSMLVIGDALFLGGLYTTLNGNNTISNYRAVDLVNGTAISLPSTSNYPSSDVTTQSLYEGKIYLGGIFTSISGIGSFPNFAIFDLGTQSYVNPSPIYANGFVNTITPGADGKFFVGGSFTGLNGSTTSNYAGAFQSKTNTIVNWAPNPDNTVFVSMYRNGKWHVGGEFIHAFNKPYGGFFLTDLTEPPNN